MAARVFSTMMPSGAPGAAARALSALRRFYDDHSGRAVLAVLVATAILARWRVWGDPIVFSDEEWYLYVARRMLAGALPYVDLWDRKPVGLFLVYLPAAPFSPQNSVYAYQALATASVVATAWLIDRTARAVGRGRGALVAAMLYILWLDLADGQGGQSPVFYNLPMMAAAWLAVRRPRIGDGAASAAMALVGCAIQIKYSAVFEGIALGLWLMAAKWRTTRSVVRVVGWGGVWAGIALAPTALAWGAYAAIGEGDTFVFANFVSIFLRHPDPPAMQWNQPEQPPQERQPSQSTTEIDEAHPPPPVDPRVMARAE